MRRAGVAGGLVLVLACGCSKSGLEEVPFDAGKDPVVPSAPAASSQAPENLSLAERVDKLGYADVLAMARPLMSDGDDSVGTTLFAYWASRHLRWTDVSVPKDETSYALARKDADSERGKRLCTSGQIVQIEVTTNLGGKLAAGLTMSNGGNLYQFFAAGSSGELVGESYARLCGVVTGKYDYPNSAGGTGHAVTLVGMFDLPENKPKKPTPAR